MLTPPHVGSLPPKQDENHRVNVIKEDNSQLKYFIYWMMQCTVYIWKWQETFTYARTKYVWIWIDQSFNNNI